MKKQAPSISFYNKLIIFILFVFLVFFFYMIDLRFSPREKAKIEFNEGSKLMYTSTSLNVRNKPSKDSRKIKTLKPNTPILTNAKKISGWVLIGDLDSNKLGYVFSKYLLNDIKQNNIEIPKKGIIEKNIENELKKFNLQEFENKYSIQMFEEDILDMGVIKAQIGQRIYFGKIDSSLSKDKIKLYLNERLIKLDNRKGFKNFNNASHIIIILHASKDHAVEGGANWIALISKFGEEEDVSYSICDKDKFDYFKNPTDSIIDNLSEEVRKEIFRAIRDIEYKALNEADLKFPDGNDWEKNSDLNTKLLKKYYKKFYKHYSITEDISNKIFIEGFKKGWLEKTGQISFKL
jgi:hypothetical protein